MHTSKSAKPIQSCVGVSPVIDCVAAVMFWSWISLHAGFHSVSTAFTEAEIQTPKQCTRHWCNHNFTLFIQLHSHGRKNIEWEWNVNFLLTSTVWLSDMDYRLQAATQLPHLGRLVLWRLLLACLRLLLRLLLRRQLESCRGRGRSLGTGLLGHRTKEGGYEGRSTSAAMTTWGTLLLELGWGSVEQGGGCVTGCAAMHHGWEDAAAVMRNINIQSLGPYMHLTR